MLMLFRNIIIGILLMGSLTLENLYSFIKYTAIEVLQARNGKVRLEMARGDIKLNT